MDYRDSVMIAFTPMDVDWATGEYPHMTLVYAGELNKLPKSAMMAMLKDTEALSANGAPLIMPVLEQTVFGKDAEQVEVLRFRPTPRVLAMRHLVERWNRSEYTEYKPHMTIGPVGTTLEYTPKAVIFDKISLSWGEDRFTFRLSWRSDER